MLDRVEDTTDDPFLRAIYARREERERGRYWRFFYAAVMASLDLDTCRALLNGEAVPKAKLDQRWVHLLARWPDGRRVL